MWRYATTAWPSSSTRPTGATATRLSIATNCGPRFTITVRLPLRSGRTRQCGALPFASPVPLNMPTRPTGGSTPSPWPAPSAGPECSSSAPPGGAAPTGCPRGPPRGHPPPPQAALADGLTVAVKGLGGYHLVCDGTSELAVAKLPRKKPCRTNRSRDGARCGRGPRLAAVSQREAAVLCGPARPIVLLPGGPAPPSAN